MYWPNKLYSTVVAASFRIKRSSKTRLSGHFQLLDRSRNHSSRQVQLMDGLPKQSQQFQFICVTLIGQEIPSYRQPVKTIFRTIPINKQSPAIIGLENSNTVSDHLPRQFQLIESSRHKLFRKFRLMDRLWSQLSGQLQLIDSPKSFVGTIPIVRKYQTPIVQITTINRQSPKLIVRTNPVNRQSVSEINCLYKSIDGLWHHLPGQF